MNAKPRYPTDRVLDPRGNLSSPKPEHAPWWRRGRDRAGPGKAGSGWAGRGGDGRSCASRARPFVSTPKERRQSSWASLWSHGNIKSYVNRICRIQTRISHGRGGTGGAFRPGDELPFRPPEQRRRFPRTSFRKHETQIPCKPNRGTLRTFDERLTNSW